MIEGGKKAGMASKENSSRGILAKMRFSGFFFVYSFVFVLFCFVGSSKVIFGSSFVADLLTLALAKGRERQK